MSHAQQIILKYYLRLAHEIAIGFSGDMNILGLRPRRQVWGTICPPKPISYIPISHMVPV